MGLPRDNTLCEFKERLRINMTESEKRLWYDFLGDYSINFVCQKIIGPYIVDFFCNSARVSIELDGSQHYEEKAFKKDVIRSTYLEMLEIKELRFPNNAIWEDFAGVCETIHFEVQKRRNDLVSLPISRLLLKK